MENSVFKTLYEIDIKPYIEFMGKTDIAFIEWSTAWRLVKEVYPSAKWKIQKFGDLSYLQTPLGFFVEGSVTIEGVEESDVYSLDEMKPTAADITKAHQRCLVKCLGRHGFGLKLWETHERDLLTGKKKPNDGSQMNSNEPFRFDFGKFDGKNEKLTFLRSKSDPSRGMTFDEIVEIPKGDEELRGYIYNFLKKNDKNNKYQYVYDAYEAWLKKKIVPSYPSVKASAGNTEDPGFDPSKELDGKYFP